MKYLSVFAFLAFVFQCLLYVMYRLLSIFDPKFGANLGSQIDKNQRKKKRYQDAFPS